jgi:hypothetical protein
MFGIIDENKKFLLLDDDRERLRVTALMLAKEETVFVPDYDEEGQQIGEHSETHYVPMFDEETVDEAIKEYADEDIEIAYNGEKYVKGFAPVIDNEYQSKMREAAYVAETDPIQTHIDRLKDKEQTPEIVAEIEALRIERDEKIAAIKARYPYAE